MPNAFRIFDRLRDVVIVVDADGLVVYINAAAQSQLGTPRSWTDCFSADVREAAESARRDAMNGTPTGFEWSAGDRAFSAEVTPVEHGVLCISRDHTQLRQSAERARRNEQMMVDTQGMAHLGTWEWKVTDPLVRWSHALYRVYGLTPETYTPSYEAYVQMVHPDDRARVIEATSRAFHEHVPYSHDERIFRPDGTMRYLHTWAFPVVDRDGTLTHLVGVCQDITDRALAEEALQRANAELELRVADRTKELELFNAMVAHDLRAPLAVVQLASDVLTHMVPAEGRPQVQRIQRAVQKMSTLMDDLLAFVRVNDMSLEPEIIDVTAAASEIVAELQAASGERTATISIASGLRVHADRALFRVVLSNVIGNAWKYTQRRADARIEVGEVERDNQRLIYVRDNGIGFDMAEYGRLFEPFRRLDNASEFVGTGVGLATVHRILTRHGGDISAESKPGEGATFFIRLPCSARA